MNIEMMNARTPPRPQGNVEGASTFTDATLLMRRGASAPSRQDVPLPWLKSLCHSLNPLPHPFDLIQTLPLPALNCAPNAPAPGNEIDGFLSPIGPIMPGQVRAPFHWRVKFPHILVSIVRQMPLAQSASQV